MLFESVVDSIGYTPLIRLHGSANTRAQLLAKMELMNPFGMKDRFARHAILMAKATGELKEGDIIVESSSGTLAVGLALVGRALNHEVHIITDPRIDPVTLAKLESLEAVVHIVDHMTAHGWQSARLEKLHQVLAEAPNAFWPRQYSNVNNPRAYAALARELLEDIGHMDVLVGPVGSGGSLCGTARVLKEANPALLVVGTDAVGSVIFDQPDRPERLQSGLGNSLVPPNVDKSIIDQVHWLNDDEAFSATLCLARDEQIFAGNSSGSAYWVARWLSTEKAAHDTVVVILPDRGDRYFRTIYSARYRSAHNVGQNSLPESPAEVAYGTSVTSWSYAHLRGA
jgi:cysteine synthase